MKPVCGRFKSRLFAFAFGCGFVCLHLRSAPPPSAPFVPIYSRPLCARVITARLFLKRTALLLTLSSLDSCLQDKERKEAAAASRAVEAARSASGSRRSGPSTRSGEEGPSDAAEGEEPEVEEVEDGTTVTIGFRRKVTANCLKFFTKTDLVNDNGTRMAKCKVCDELVTCSNTTNLAKHCKRWHEDLWYLDVKSGLKVNHGL